MKCLPSPPYFQYSQLQVGTSNASLRPANCSSSFLQQQNRRPAGISSASDSDSPNSSPIASRRRRRAGPSRTPNEPSSSITSATTPSSPTPANPRLPSPSRQPTYPAPIPTTTSPEPQVRVSSPTRWSLRTALIGGGNPSPFRRGRSGTTSSTVSSRAQRPSAARLWNPSNSTPRVHPQAQQQRAGNRLRRHSPDENRTPIAIPLDHPELSLPRAGAAAGGDYPLLTLPEKRQSLHSGSTRASLQVERSGSSTGTNRISLPRSVSIDISRRSGDVSPITPKLNKGKGRAFEYDDITTDGSRFQLERKVTIKKRSDSTSAPHPTAAGISFDRKGKGKGKAIMSEDLERGPTTQNPYTPGGTSNLPDHPSNTSNSSLHTGIGPAMSSNNTSIIGSDGPVADPGEEWGPQHPCFPHMNPHVPLSSPLYQTTRIIRIRRDWMLEGDLAPTFSNLYPEILDPAGVSEQEFRTIVEKVNNELVPAFSPWNVRNIIDGFIGLVTGWIWDDLGFTGVKNRLNNVERYLEDWNREMEGKSKDGPGSAPQIVPLRRTGYMNLDIQVPDPEISYPTDSRTNTGLSRTSQSP